MTKQVLYDAMRELLGECPAGNESIDAAIGLAKVLGFKFIKDGAYGKLFVAKNSDGFETCRQALENILNEHGEHDDSRSDIR